MRKRTRRWLWVLLLIPVAAGVFRLRFDVDVLALLPRAIPEVEGLRIYQERFADSRDLVITLTANEADAAESAARSLAAHLRESGLSPSVAWQPPWDEHPEQSAELLAFLWFNQPPEIFGQLTNRLAPRQMAAQLATARDRLTTSFSPEEIAQLSYDPLGLMQLPDGLAGGTAMLDRQQSLFASADGRFRILFARAPDTVAGYRASAVWFGKIQTAIDGWLPENDSVAIRFTGGPAFASEIGAGMETDMRRSVIGTALIISILFWIMHRRLRPLLWLILLMAFILGITIALGGLIFGSLNVVSAGFAAILLGLAVDYGMVLHQESRDNPGASPRQIRRRIAPSILWAALTTAAAFAALNFSSLPGISQLGSLVAIGIMVAAFVMLTFYLGPITPAESNGSKTPSPFHDPRETNGAGNHPGRMAARIATAVCALIAALLVVQTGPKFDPSADALRPGNSPVYETLELIGKQLGQTQEPAWLILGGTNELAVSRGIHHAELLLETARLENRIERYLLPGTLWPQPQTQSANRNIAAEIVRGRGGILASMLEHGFTEASFEIAGRMIDTWDGAIRGQPVFWPTNDVSRWILDKVAARGDGRYYALGMIYPDPERPWSPAEIAALERALKQGGSEVWLTQWEMLGPAVFGRVKREVWLLFWPMTATLVLALALAFRRAREVALSLGVLAFAGLMLWASMGILGWSWNLLNLMALPLLLGLCIDYSIHVQLALRRHHGKVRVVRRTTGRALLLCAATTIGAFASLSFSSNAGLASLGQVCALGVAIGYFSAVHLLPAWWRPAAPFGETIPEAAGPLPGFSAEPKTTPLAKGDEPPGPPNFYTAPIWRLGLRAGRALPRGLSEALAGGIASLAWHTAAQRREIVIQNLLPVVNGDRTKAVETGRRLFQNFSTKLLDLWHYENGLPIDHLFLGWTGWNELEQARAEGQGVLLLTPHLGNWEFGAPLLSQNGIPLLVVTQEEPDSRLTRLRTESRARWGIETLVIGRDPFAFVEIIRRLQEGSIVALLVDRPPSGTAARVELFGHPFDASIAPAELARASGCALLPVYLPRLKGGYTAQMLPRIKYERARLRQPESRRNLAQQIMTAFEPVIREHPDQWYHFVPAWPAEQPPLNNEIPDSH